MSSTTHPLRGPSAVYKSLPLRRDRLSTRVLALLPGKKGDQVRCTLKTTVINASTEYEALSYTWGTSPRRRDILVNGRHFAVTENLEEALGALRLPRRVRWIWADAICINQEDLVERAEQVREMGSIFRNASRVLIWLGSWDPESHFLEPFHRKNLHKVLTSPWWTRVWVIQELSLAAADPRLIMGNFTIQWSKFLRLVRDEEARDPDLQWYTGKVLELAAMKQDALQPPRLRYSEGTNAPSTDLEDSLFAWLSRTSSFDASDPRDKVYAILPLARTHFPVDYRITVDELGFSLLRTAISNHHDLDLLALRAGQEFPFFNQPRREPLLPFTLTAASGDGCAPAYRISFMKQETLKMEPDRHWLRFMNAAWVAGHGPDRSKLCTVDGSKILARAVYLGKVTSTAPAIRCPVCDRTRAFFRDIWDSCPIGAERQFAQEIFLPQAPEEVLRYVFTALLLGGMPEIEQRRRYLSLQDVHEAVQERFGRLDSTNVHSRDSPLFWVPEPKREEQILFLRKEGSLPIHDGCKTFHALNSRNNPLEASFLTIRPRVDSQEASSPLLAAHRLKHTSDQHELNTLNTGLVCMAHAQQRINVPGRTKASDTSLIASGDEIYLPLNSRFAYAVRPNGAEGTKAFVGPVFVCAPDHVHGRSSKRTVEHGQEVDIFYDDPDEEIQQDRYLEDIVIV